MTSLRLISELARISDTLTLRTVGDTGRRRAMERAKNLAIGTASSTPVCS